MTTLSQFIDATKHLYGASCSTAFFHPTLYVIVRHTDFAGLSELARREVFCRKVHISAQDVERLQRLMSVSLTLLDEREEAPELSFTEHTTGTHWLPWFGSETKPAVPEHSSSNDAAARVIHFYGYKGGQGRSTLLALFAKSLADDGYRVLMLDADLEAPSLDSLFSVACDSPEFSFMGLCGWADTSMPISGVYIGSSQNGIVDLIAARPRGPAYDMDYAAFLLGASLDSGALQIGVSKLLDLTQKNDASPGYDILLVDHRTGLSTSVLPIMQSAPGPVVIFARPDSMSSRMEVSLIDALLSQDTDCPGAFVNFSLEASADAEASSSSSKFAQSLLERLSLALGKLDSTAEPIDPAELDEYWIHWFHDPLLLKDALPGPQEIHPRNAQSVRRLRQLLSVDESRKNPLPLAPIRLSLSGGTDEGWFILTPELARLFRPDNPYLYIFGRKGTGKSRLLRELHARGLGEPVFVASDYREGGVPSNGLTSDKLLRACDDDPRCFWWTLLHAAIEMKDRTQTGLSNHIDDLIDLLIFTQS